MKILIIVQFILIVFLFGCQSSELEDTLADPSTIINFSLPEESYVKLQVFNSYEVVVANLVDGNKPAGFHFAIFNSKNIAEGLYYFVLESTGKSTGRYKKIVKQFVVEK